MAVDQLFTLLYDELRELARRQRRRWQGDYTLNTTALLHEAYLKLAGQHETAAESRAHFLALAARAMRHILCNYARDRHALKRGGGLTPLPLDDAAAVSLTGTPDGEPADLLVALDEALQRLERAAPRQSRVVECRFFGALGVEETAEALGISPRTVKRDWAAAQTWLQAELTPLLESRDASSDFLEDLGARTLPAALDALADEVVPVGGRVGRYEILERIGAGGMGVVYKARDPGLDRLVALKFLPSSLSADAAARDRLRREARAVSALDHPNVAVVYEIGAAAIPGEEDGDRLFIAMAFYEGETLRRRIARGPVAVADALDWAVQAAEGLSAAHRAGFVHRDIKPANLLLTEGGRLKIVDFGVPGVAGTLAYMSPEQTRAESVDERADVWALGVVLYEMLAGVRPFRGDTDAAVQSAIRSEVPPPVASLRLDIPPGLPRVVDRCLAKDRAQRYRTAEELASDLRSVSAAAGEGEPQPSVVVLPFAVIAADPANEYLGAGLTDEVIAGLSRIRALRVIARGSAMRLMEGRGDVGAVARDVGVRYVLEGGVRTAGARLRITVRFVDAYTGSQLWARTFAGTIEDVLEIQEQVAHAIVDALRIRLSAGEAQMLAGRPIPDPRAYESYLRARYEAWRFSSAGLERARRYIETALAIVGDNELLYSTLGHITAGYREAGIDPDGTALDRVDALAEKVFALNPDSARGHLLRAFVAFYRGDMRGALIAGGRAHALEPDDADTLLLLGYVCALTGRNGEAHAFWERALRIDPLTPLTHAVQGFIAILEGRFEDAVAPYRRCYEMDPESPFSAVCVGWSLAYARRTGEALPMLDTAAVRFRDTAFGSWAGALAQGLRGDAAGVTAAITPLMETTARESEMFARAVAHAYALAGETQTALDWLERQVGLGMLNHRFLAQHDWFLDALRGEPRFTALLEQVRVRAAALA